MPALVAIRVVRVSDGHVVRTRTFAAGTSVITASSGRVLLGRYTSGPANTVNGRTLGWDPSRNSITTLLRQLPVAASTKAQRVAVINGKREEVRGLRTKRVVWRTPAGHTVPSENVLSFSPDDKRVVTPSGSTGAESDGAPWNLARKLRVRDARSGELLVTFTGNFAVEVGDYLSGVAPVWESNTSLLLHATSDRVLPDPEDEYTWPNASVIRCSTVTATCVKVPVDIRDALVVRKSN